MTIRLRFAPSPTGYLHIGGARTALFNWLYARHVGGEFVLRIEDTDRARSTDASRDAILEGLTWLGIDWDNEPVVQSARFDEHVRLANELLAQGKAYKCYCTPEELEAMREVAMSSGRTALYDGTWRERTDHPEGRPYTVRIKMPTEGKTVVEDRVLGTIEVDNADLDDFIILRSDGTPTYNFVVVCDDAFMGITHVVRGQDHMTNTFRQYHVYEALGHPVPVFAHLPLVDGLSKRKGSASVQHYRDAGYLAEAVVNYIARLGWSHGDQELFDREELIALFDIADVNRGSGRYDETKMTWVNAQWMKRLEARDVAERLLPFLAARGIEGAEVNEGLVLLVANLQERATTLVEMAEKAEFLYRPPAAFDDKAVKKWMKAGVRPAFAELIGALDALTEFTPATIEPTLEQVVAKHETTLGKIAQPIRIALTGSSVSPSIYETMAAVGHKEVVARMQAAMALFPTQEA